MGTVTIYLGSEATIADYGEKTTDIEGVDVFDNHIFFHCRNHQDPKEEKHSILIAQISDLL